jgi:hypothetical protein
LLRGDLKTRYAAYLIGRQGEWLSANDVLRMENMSPRTDPGGDEYKNPVTKDSGTAGEMPATAATIKIEFRKGPTWLRTRAKLRQSSLQLAAIDPAVAIELSAMTDCLARSMRASSEPAARDASVPRSRARSR